MLAVSRIHETLFYEATLPNADKISKYRLWTEMEKFRRLRKLRTLNVQFEVKRIYLVRILPANFSQWHSFNNRRNSTRHVKCNFYFLREIIIKTLE